MKKLLLLVLTGLAFLGNAQVNFPKDTIDLVINEGDGILNEAQIPITNNSISATLDYNYNIFYDEFKGRTGWTVKFCDCNSCKENYDPTGSCTSIAASDTWTFVVDVITKTGLDNKYFSIGFINPNDPTDADTITIRTKIGNRLGTKSLNSLNANFEIVPNPSSFRTSISFDAASGKAYNLSVINLIGESVEQFEVNGNNQISTTNLDVSGLQSGIYFVFLSDGIKSEVQKLVVN